MKIFSRKQVESDVFSDGGMVHKIDLFSIHTIILSSLISIGLIVLAVLAMIW